MTLALQILCLASTLLLIAGVLAHRGNGGGLSDLLGGGSGLASSAHANRNLTRLTLGVALIWAATVIALGLLTH